MIVADQGSLLSVVTQSDHAQLAASLLGLWRADGLAEHPRRSDLLVAIREHDNGWQGLDAAPRISPGTGAPTSFDQISAGERLDIWRRGVRRYVTELPYTSLLILRHAREINRRFWAETGWQDFEAELDALEAELLETADVQADEIRADYAWLRLGDTLSLGACGAFGSETFEGSLEGYRFELALGRIRLAPFPFAGVTTLEIAFRQLPKRTFADDLDLAGELAAATWRRRPVRVERLVA